MTPHPITMIIASAAISLLAACQPGADTAAAVEPAPVEDTAPPPTPLPPVPDAADQYGPADEHRAGGEAHVHGEAELAAIVEGNRLSVTFDSPLASLVGFEHAPQTDAEQAAIDALQDQFLSETALIDLPSNLRCEIASVSSGLRHRDDHGSLMVEQDFICKKLPRMANLTVTVFETFDGLEHVDVIVLGDNLQVAAELTPSRTVLDFGH